MSVTVKSSQDIIAMREGGKMLATVLHATAKKAVAGISTMELSRYAESELKKLGGQPAFLGYEGYPAALCVSVNEEVVHGIPSDKRLLAEGDLVSLDFGVRHKGLITDSAISLYVGDASIIDSDIRALLSVTERALYAGIDAARADAHIGDISAAVQSVLDAQGLGIIRDLVGHGVGYDVHEDPNVPNYGRAGTGMRLREGMTIAIEPMATLGDWSVDILPDKWTVITRDGSLAAHFEHTVAITAEGAEILTAL